MEQAAENLTDEQRELAVKLADRLYGGAFGGYLNDFDPFTPALSNDFADKSRIRRSKALRKSAQDPVIRDASQNYLVAHLSAQAAWSALLNLATQQGPFLLGSQQFGEAYEVYTKHGEHFGYMTELFGPKGRYKYVMIEMLTERAIPDTEWGKVRENPLAAQGYLMVAAQSLKLAHERFIADRTSKLNKLLWDTTRQMADARSFGSTRRGVRSVYQTRRDALLDEQTREVPYVGTTTFGALVGKLLDEHIAEESAKYAVDVAEFVEQGGDSSLQLDGTEFTEQVTATGEGGGLNYQTFLYQEQDLLRREAQGEDTLQRNTTLAQLGKLLLQGMLRDLSRESQYAQITRLFRDSMAARPASAKIPFADSKFLLADGGDPFYEESLRPEGRVRKDDLAQRLRAFGQRLFVLSSVARELATRTYGKKIRDRLRVPDSAGFYVDLGDGWSRRAAARQEDDLGSVLTAIDARMNAVFIYLQSISRYEDSYGAPKVVHRGVEIKIVYQRGGPGVSSSVYLALAQSAVNVYHLLDAAIERKNELGLRSEQQVVDHLGGTPQAGAMAVRFRGHRERISDLMDLARESTLIVRDRGPSANGLPPDPTYASFIDALATLILVDGYRAALATQRGKSEQSIVAEMEASFALLEATPPGTGAQYLSRGLIYHDRLGHDAFAVRDLCAAVPLLVQAGDSLRSERALRRVTELGRECVEPGGRREPCASGSRWVPATSRGGRGCRPPTRGWTQR